MDEKRKKIELSIDGRKISAFEGMTVLEIARQNQIKIPALCYHPDLEIKANCRLCLVEIEGEKQLKTSCNTYAKEGMNISTSSPRVKALRKTNLEMIWAEHRKDCDDCLLYDHCPLLKLAQEYGVANGKFKNRKAKNNVYEFGPIQLDQTKCIDCRNCVEICSKQSEYLKIKGRGADLEVVPSKEKGKDCIYCGQCIVHCPVAAIESKCEYDCTERALGKKGQTKIIFFAPSIRASIGEVFGLPYGQVMTGQLVAGLKKLGFDKVFDVAAAADFTTIEEAKELISRIKQGGVLPMFTSCCPAWVKWLEFYRPDLIPNLTTAKSPQMMLGGLIKTYWAKHQKIDPKRIWSVSIMPCTAKKWEKDLIKAEVDGMNPVDFVITTRELGWLFRKNGVDLKKIKEENADDPLGYPSGAGVIYGATGGVMESALRTAYKMITGSDLKELELQQVRGIKGFKRSEVKIGDLTLKVAVVNGMENARMVLEELKTDPKAYDYVEVMACPGGCIGGGGQPLPVSDEIRLKRAQSLYSIDQNRELRLAHENPVVKDLYDKFLDEKTAHHIFHTCYHPQSKARIKKIGTDQ